MAELEDKRTGASGSPTPMQRAEELLSAMTVEEKAMLLSCIYPMGLLEKGPIQSQLDTQLGQGIGHIAGIRYVRFSDLIGCSN
jgi:hypothetical protein